MRRGLREDMKVVYASAAELNRELPAPCDSHSKARPPAHDRARAARRGTGRSGSPSKAKHGGIPMAGRCLRCDRREPDPPVRSADWIGPEAAADEPCVFNLRQGSIVAVYLNAAPLIRGKEHSARQPSRCCRPATATENGQDADGGRAWRDEGVFDVDERPRLDRDVALKAAHLRRSHRRDCWRILPSDKVRAPTLHQRRYMVSAALASSTSQMIMPR